jgi:hypothetical protein
MCVEAVGAFWIGEYPIRQTPPKLKISRCDLCRFCQRVQHEMTHNRVQQ